MDARIKEFLIVNIDSNDYHNNSRLAFAGDYAPLFEGQSIVWKLPPTDFFNVRDYHLNLHGNAEQKGMGNFFVLCRPGAPIDQQHKIDLTVEISLDGVTDYLEENPYQAAMFVADVGKSEPQVSRLTLLKNAKWIIRDGSQLRELATGQLYQPSVMLDYMTVLRAAPGLYYITVNRHIISSYTDINGVDSKGNRYTSLYLGHYLFRSMLLSVTCVKDACANSNNVWMSALVAKNDFTLKINNHFKEFLNLQNDPGLDIITTLKHSQDGELHHFSFYEGQQVALLNIKSNLEHFNIFQNFDSFQRTITVYKDFS